MTPLRRPVVTEEGLSLVEVLVTVVIIGICFVAVLGGMWTAIVTSDTHRKQALGETYLISAAEFLKSNDTTPYKTCGTGTYSLSGLPVTSVPADWQAEMTVAVEYWDGSAFVASPATCPDPLTRLTLQQVTITATSPVDHRATETLTIAKRPS